MKRKLDFITNSSSCSFVAWGISIDTDTLKEKYGQNIFKIYKKKEDEKKHKKALNQGAFMTVPSEDSKEKLEAECESFLNDDFVWSVEECLDGLEIQNMPYEDEVMIGKSPFDIKEDQSLKEFKQEICDKFKLIGMDIKPDELGQIEECWMDN